MRLRIARKIAANHDRMPKGSTLHDNRQAVITLARAIARLRKSWRHRQPMNDGSRQTDDDFFRSNRLASLYHRLQWMQDGDFERRKYPNVDCRGKRRSLQ